MFKKLSDRVPNLTESYTVDHAMERGRIDEISNIMKKMDARKITELFLKISELAAVHRSHMDKEELHLLPYFLKNFDDTEISELIGQCQSTINAKLHEHKRNGLRTPLTNGHTAETITMTTNRKSSTTQAVSYTHLTLPTIYSV